MLFVASLCKDLMLTESFIDLGYQERLSHTLMYSDAVVFSSPRHARSSCAICHLCQLEDVLPPSASCYSAKLESAMLTVQVAVYRADTSQQSSFVNCGACYR